MLGGGGEGHPESREFYDRHPPPSILRWWEKKRHAYPAAGEPRHNQDTVEINYLDQYLETLGNEPWHAWCTVQDTVKQYAEFYQVRICGHAEVNEGKVYARQKERKRGNLGKGKGDKVCA